MRQLAQRANIYARIITSGIADIVKKEVIKSFLEATQRSKPNSTATLFYKPFTLPLMATGSLMDAIQKPDINIMESNIAVVNFSQPSNSIVELIYMMPEAGTEVFSDYGMIGFEQTRKNPNYVYLWSQEYGAKVSPRMFKFGVRQWGHFAVPKRAFFKKGVMNGMREALIFSTYVINNLMKWYQSLPAEKFTIPDMGLERETRFTNQDLLMMVAPPTMLYAGIGGGMDYFNVLRGSFNINNFEQWFTQMAKGSVGATRLSQRRQMRKRLWK